MSTDAFSEHVAKCHSGPGGRCPYENATAQRLFIDACLSLAAVKGKNGLLYRTQTFFAGGKEQAEVDEIENISLSATASNVVGYASSSAANGGGVSSSTALTNRAGIDASPLASASPAKGATARSKNKQPPSSTNSKGNNNNHNNQNSSSSSSSTTITTAMTIANRSTSGRKPSAVTTANATTTASATTQQDLDIIIDEGLAHYVPLDTMDISPLLVTVLWLGDEDLALKLMGAPNPPGLRTSSRDGATPAWVAACLGMTRVLDALRERRGALSGFVDTTYRHTVLHALVCDSAFLGAFTTHAGTTVPKLPADASQRASYVLSLAKADGSLLELRDAKGCTPLENAMRHGSTACALALLAAGAKLPSRARGQWLACERSLKAARPSSGSSNGVSTPVGAFLPAQFMGPSTLMTGPILGPGGSSSSSSSSSSTIFGGHAESTSMSSIGDSTEESRLEGGGVIGTGVKQLYEYSEETEGGGGGGEEGRNESGGEKEQEGEEEYEGRAEANRSDVHRRRGGGGGGGGKSGGSARKSKSGNKTGARNHLIVASSEQSTSSVSNTNNNVDDEDNMNNNNNSSSSSSSNSSTNNSGYCEDDNTSPLSSDDEIVQCDNAAEDGCASPILNPFHHRKWRRAKRVKQRMLKQIEQFATRKGILWGAHEVVQSVGGMYEDEKPFQPWGVFRIIVLFIILSTIAIVFRQGRQHAIEQAMAAKQKQLLLEQEEQQTSVDNHHST